MNANLPYAIPNIIGQTPAQTLAAIRAPHFIPEVLLQKHTILIVLLMIAGLALYYYARQRQQHRALLPIRAGLAILLCWLFMTILFITPSERLKAAHDRILKAAQAKDIPRVINDFADDFHWGPFTKDAMAPMIRTTLDIVTIKSFYLNNYQADIDGPDAQTRFQVIVYTDSGQTPTAWQLHWIDDPKSDWKLLTVDKWRLADQEMPPGLPTGAPFPIDH